MIASRVASPEDPAVLSQRGYCRSLRHALEAIPGAAPARTGTEGRGGRGRHRGRAGGGPPGGGARDQPGRGRGSRSRGALGRDLPVDGPWRRSGLTGAPGVGKSTLAAGIVAHARAARAARGRLAVDPTRRTPAAPCSAIACGCRSTRPTPTSSSARWRRADTSAGWRSPPRGRPHPRRRRARLGDRRDGRRGSGRGRRGRRHRHGARRPGAGDGRRRADGESGDPEVPTASWSTRRTARAPPRSRASYGRCCTSARHVIGSADRVHHRDGRRGRGRALGRRREARRLGTGVRTLGGEAARTAAARDRVASPPSGSVARPPPPWRRTES